MTPQDIGLKKSILMVPRPRWLHSCSSQITQLQEGAWNYTSYLISPDEMKGQKMDMIFLSICAQLGAEDVSSSAINGVRTVKDF